MITKSLQQDPLIGGFPGAFNGLCLDWGNARLTATRTFFSFSAQCAMRFEQYGRSLEPRWPQRFLDKGESMTNNLRTILHQNVTT
jgi:hypothetical protein